MEPLPPPSPSVPGARLRPALRRGGLAVGALAVLWVAAHLAADREPVRARLRARAAEVLAARLPGAVLGGEAGIDWAFRAWVGPVTIPGDAAGAAPVVRVERVLVRVALLPLLAGRVEAAAVRLAGVQVVPGPGGRELLHLVERLRAPRPKAAAAPAEPRRSAEPVLEVRRLTIDLAVGARAVALGPFDARVARSRGDAGEDVTGWLGLPGGGSVDVAFHRDGEKPTANSTANSTSSATSSPSPARPRSPRPAAPAERPWTASLSAQASAADLPAALHGHGVDLTAGRLDLTARAASTPEGARVELGGGLAHATLGGARLGPEPVGPIDVNGRAALAWSRRDGKVALRDAELRPLGPLQVTLDGTLTLGPEGAVDLTVTVPPVAFDALVQALPAALAPGPSAPRPAGPLSARFHLSGPARRPAEWLVEGGLDLAALREAARKAPPSPLRATFTARPEGDAGPAVIIGPENPDFVPLGALPDHVVRCITTSEDAGFFAHQGFDFGELKNALAAAGQAGRLLRGGSTISQQLAKNLFLTRDRTLARKVREAFASVGLEATVPKARLMEIYLNLVEWGPALHGIGPAARRYFGKDARALTPREACFLAAAIPSPLRTHAAVAAGVPPDRWASHVDDLLGKLGVVGVLTPEQVAEAQAERLRFAGQRALSAEEAAAAAQEGAATAEGGAPDPAEAPPAATAAGQVPAASPVSP